MAASDHHFAFHSGPAAQASKLFLRNMESTSLCSESSVFSVQMWKAAGLTPKLVGKRPMDNGTPSATPRYRSGGQQQLARSGLSSSSFSGFTELNPKSLKAAAIQAYETSVAEESAAQLSGSTGHSPAPKGASERGERDPISSTPRAGGHLHHHTSDPVTTAEAALAARQRQVHQLARALQRCTSQGQVAASGPGIAPDPRPCLICGISCLVYVTVPGVSAPLAPQPSLAASATTGAAVAAAIAQVAAGGPEQPASDAAAGSASASAAIPAKLLHHAASAPAAAAPEPPSGPPPLIGCSQCRKPMHLDCFVAHYGVVPARRDYTYCPAHVYVPKPKPLAERRAGSGQERKLGGGGTSHERRTANGHGGHKRERVEREAERKKKRRVERDPSLDEDNDDGDGDYVPRATTMRLRGTSPAPAPRRSAGARLRTRSSSNGGIATTAAAAAAAGSAVEAGNAGISGDGAAPRQGDAEASDGGDGARGPARVKVAPAELHESRSGSPADRSPADGDYDALQQPGDAAMQPWAAAEERGPCAAVSIGERLGSGGGSSVSGEQPQEGSEAAADPSRGLLHPGDTLAGLERVRVPKHQRSARTPRAAPAPALPGGSPRKAPLGGGAAVAGDAPSTPRSAVKSERGRDANVRSPRARPSGDLGFSDERSGGRHAGVTVRRPSGDSGKDGDGKPSASLRAAASGSLDSRAAAAAAPSSQRDREHQPQSPRGGGASTARAAVKSPLKSPRLRDGSLSKGEKTPRPSSAQLPDAPATAAALVTPTELNDEELARLLHEELNAPSRRRAAKRPGLPDAFTTPPLSPLGSATPLSSGGGSSAKKAPVSTERRPVSAMGTPVAGGSGGGGAAGSSAAPQ